MIKVATHTTILALCGVMLLLPWQARAADEPAAEPDSVGIAAPPAETPPSTHSQAGMSAEPAAVLPAPTAPGIGDGVAGTAAAEPPTGIEAGIAADHPARDDATGIESRVESAPVPEIAEVEPSPSVSPLDEEPAAEELAGPAPAEAEAVELPADDGAHHGAVDVEESILTEAAPGNVVPDPMQAESTTAAAGIRQTAESAGLAIDTLSAETEEQLPDVPLADAVTIAEELQAAHAMTLLNAEVPPGAYRRLSWSATELFEGIPVATPVLAVNGRLPGPTLCLTAAVHGDELNGIEMVRRVMHDLDPEKLSGAVIGVPIVNLQGFRRGSRYLPDRRDLNRYFPGNPNGSAASRIAHSFFTEVVLNCDALIDLHTGSFERANLPQLRADLRNPDVVTLTHGFGATVILHSDPAEGTLRYAATKAGIATVTLEAGGPSELELKEVMHGVKGIETLLSTLGMVKKARLWGDPEPVYYRSVWVRADRGGILLADVSLGSTVRRGDLLGTITDPMNNASTNLYAPFSGRVIGMARNQVVMPGFAAFHVGIQTAEAKAADNRGDNSDDALAHDTEVTNDDYIDGMSE